MSTPEMRKCLRRCSSLNLSAVETGDTAKSRKYPQAGDRGILTSDEAFKLEDEDGRNSMTLAWRRGLLSTT